MDYTGINIGIPYHPVSAPASQAVKSIINSAGGSLFSLSELNTLFQDAEGTIPVTTYGDPIGLILDAANPAAAVGGNIISNSTFASSTSGWSSVDATLASVAGELKVTNTSAAAGCAYIDYDFSPDNTYVLKAKLRAGTANARVLVLETKPDNSVEQILFDSGPITSGTFVDYSIVFQGFDMLDPVNNTKRLRLQTNSTTVGETSFYDDVYLYEHTGLALAQPVAASRPEFRTDGSNNWAVPDAVDDYLHAVLPAAVTSGITLAITGEGSPDTPGCPFCINDQADYRITGGGGIRVSSSEGGATITSSPVIALVPGGGVLSAYNSGAVDEGDFAVGIGDFITDSCTLYDSAGGTTVDTAAGFPATADHLVLGASVSEAFNSYGTGFIYSAAYIPSRLSAADRSVLMNLFSQQYISSLEAIVRKAIKDAGGSYYDFSNLSSMYQDTAGTVPVTSDGDPVGKVLDLSGNGRHITAPSNDARPIYHTDGTYHWLTGDGVDDELSIELSSAISSPTTLFMAGDGTADQYAGFVTITDPVDGTVTGGGGIRISPSEGGTSITNSPVLAHVPGEGAAVGYDQGTEVEGDPCAAICLFETGSASLYDNLRATTTNTTAVGFTSSATSFRLFAAQKVYSGGDLHFAGFVPAEFNTSVRYKLMTLLKTKNGS